MAAASRGRRSRDARGNGGDAGSLPTPLSSFVGREPDLAATDALLARGDLRLLTITGAGGVGKTRLAIELAGRASSRFADGVRFVPLAPVSDPDLVASATGRALGLKEEGALRMRERLAAFLREREMLLVFDNFEHVLPAAGLVADLLAAGPDVRIVVTSRSPLRLTAEQEYALEPLAFPPPDDLPDAEKLAAYAAVELFVERATAVDPGFALGPDNAAAVAGICARLDGLPLALELAAARAKVLSPDAMLARLSRPLKLLTQGPVDLPERQRALRTTIEWSHGLLTPDERRVLARLSVFAGPFVLEVAEALAGLAPNAPRDPLGTIASLVDHSLLRRADGEGAEPRLAMLDTIREFARERLAAGGEEQAVRAAHAQAFLARAEAAAPHLGTADEDAPLDALEVDRHDLRLAMRWFLQAGDAERSRRMSAALGRMWLVRGYLAEGRAWADAALLLTPSGEDAPLRARALRAAGMLAHYQNDYDVAAARFEEALALGREHGDRSGIAHSLIGLATVIGRHRDPAAARAMSQEALAIFEELGDRTAVIRAQERLGTLLWYEGDHRAARPLLERSLEGARAIGHRHAEASAMQALGWVELADRDEPAARRLLESAVVAMRDLGDRWNVARATFALGFTALHRGAVATARARFVEALTIVSALGDRLLTCGCIGGVGDAIARGGRTRAAVVLFGAADRHRALMGANHSAYVREMRTRAVAAAAEALGEATFAEAWEEGEGTTLEDAVALALAEAEAAAGGETAPGGLTGREVDVLRLVATGLSDHRVAEELFVSVRTVNAHMRSIFRKLQVTSRAAATRWAIEHELS